MVAKREVPAPEQCLHFDAPAEWDAWLRKHHATSAGAWLRLAKVGADAASITYAQALDVALCHGWIDAKSLSDGPTHWLKRFVPRAARSIWSKVNRDKAMALVADGRMQAAGLAEIARAKADGRWEAAYDPSSRSAVPMDLQTALDASPAAAAFFTTLDSKNRYAILFRLQTAKRLETRARRIETFVAMLAQGEKLHP